MKRILAFALSIVMILATFTSCTPAVFLGIPFLSFLSNDEVIESVIPEETTPEATTPEATTPEAEPPVFPEFETSLPKASKIIASIIGVVAATVEVTQDSQFVVVLEQDDEYSGTDGCKQVLFFEVAEASVNSDGELLKANLTVKIGEAVVMLSENISAADIVVSKEDITSYYEFSVVVNGDDVLVTVNDQNQTFNFSQLVYTAIAQMIGVESVDVLETILAQAQENANVTQELQDKLLPMLAAALGGAIEELPTVSPEYSDHIDEVFASFAQDMYTVTVDEETGYTTYSLDISALKNLLSDIEDKTLAEYLEGVYGENVVGSFSSFLKSLPDKKVRDIVDAAVTLAETTGTDIQDIYELIDAYIYSVTGVEFSIEQQINTRYNDTLVELLAEYNGVQPEEEADFVANVKASFEQVATTLETISVDEILSVMFMEAEEGFFEALKETIDRIGEQIVYNYTVDAEGVLIETSCSIGELQFNWVKNGEATIITVSLPNGVEVILSAKNQTPELIINQDGEQIAVGDIIITQEVVGQDTLTTVEFDFCFGEDDLLDATLSGILIGDSDTHIETEFDMVLRGYRNESEYYYNPETEESYFNYVEELAEVIIVTYAKDIDEFGNTLGYTFNAIVNTKDVTIENSENAESGEYYEIYAETYHELLAVECNKSVEGSFAFDLLLGEMFGVQFSQDIDELNVSVTNGGETVASGNISTTTEMVGEDVVSTIVMDLCNSENDLFDYTLVTVNGVITEFEVVVRGTYVEEEWVETPMTEEELEQFYKMYGISGETNGDNYIVVTPGDSFVSFEDSFEGGLSSDLIYVGAAFTTGEWVRTETFVEFLNVKFSNNGDENVFEFGAHESIMSGAEHVVITTTEDQISVTLTQDDVVIDATATLIENGIKITVSDKAVFEITGTTEGELVIDINIDELYLYDYGYEKCYIAFDGAIVIKIA